MARKPSKPYREPWVLDIHKPQPPSRATLDKQLDDLMRALWENDAYWAEHNMPKPAEPYPGLAAIRAMTGV